MSDANAVLEIDWPQEIPVEELEVVYLRDMANDPRFDGINKRVTALEEKQRTPTAVATLPASKVGPEVKPENWFKRNSYAIAIGSLVVAALSLVFGSGAGDRTVGLWIDNRIDNRMSKPLERLGNIETTAIKTNEKVGLMYDLLVAQLKASKEAQGSLKAVLDAALDRARPADNTGGDQQAELQRGVAVIEMARELNVPLDGGSLARYGLESIQVASQKQELRDIAWKGAQLAIANWTSQSDLRSIMTGKKWITGEEWLKGVPSEYIHSKLEFKNVTQYFTEPIPSAPGKCWMALGIADPDFSTRVARCPEFGRYVGDGTYPSLPPLDGSKFRNVIFEHVRFAYNGGPIIMENVAFIDCKVDFPMNAGTVNLAQLILQGKDVTYRKSS